MIYIINNEKIISKESKRGYAKLAFLAEIIRFVNEACKSSS